MSTSVNVECVACGATGIYHGFAEPEGVGVVCEECKGSGYVEFEYEPFVELKQRDNINIVQRSRGTFIGTGMVSAEKSVTYREFLEGRMP